jgi:hypothetical protein
MTAMSGHIINITSIVVSFSVAGICDCLEPAACPQVGDELHGPFFHLLFGSVGFFKQN